MTSVSEVRVLTTVAELESIRDSWQSWPGNDDSDMEMYLAYLASSPEVERPHVIVVYRSGTPDVIWVGRLESVRLDFNVGYLHLRPKAKVLYFVYGGPRGNVSEENCEFLVREVRGALARREADCAYLNYLTKDSHICSLARTVPTLLCRDYESKEQVHFSAKLGDGADEFYKTLSAKTRNQLRRQAKRLIQAFPEGIDIRRFRSEDEVDTLAHDAEVIAQKSYQRGLGVGFVDSAAMRQHLKAKAHKGGLRGHVLYVRERPCAFWIGSLNVTTFGSDFLGFDPEFATYSPGMYLMTRVIEGFFSGSDGLVTAVDFATGSAQYKEVLGNCKWNERSSYIFAPSIRGFELSLLRLLTGVIDKSVKRLLVQTGLLARVRRVWRARARRQAEASASCASVGSEEAVRTV